MHFNNGELPPEMGEEFEPEVPEENLDWKITIEFEKVREPGRLIIDKILEYGLQDDYLKKELERQEQEKLSEMLPKRLP